MSVSEASVAQLVERLVGSTLLGKYRVDALIGWGGAAAVFSATHRNGHRVAVKILHPSVATDESTRSRFLREGYLANNVSHGGAVRVLDDDRLPDGSVLLVMELLDGRGLDAEADARGGKLSLDQVCNVAYQLLDVLAAAHDRGIVHRDIKPQNLFWTKEGVLKVLDFGLARLHAPDASQVITQTGEVFGTPAFMPPEQAIGDMDRVDAASDQWSAAAAIFNLATGKYVHDARTPTEMIVLCATKPPRSIREVDPAMPPRIADVIDRALRFDKAERWPHVRDFQRELKQAYRVARGGSLAMPTLQQPGSIPPLTGPVAAARGVGARFVIAAVAAAVVTGAGISMVRAIASGPADPANDPKVAAPGETPRASETTAPPAASPAVAAGEETAPAAAESSAPSASSASPRPVHGARRTAPAPPRTKRDPWSAQ